MRFIRIWFNTEHIDRGILVREWAAGNRISNVQRTDSGNQCRWMAMSLTGVKARHHTLDTLDMEIACALLPMDFNHLEIPVSIHRPCQRGFRGQKRRAVEIMERHPA